MNIWLLSIVIALNGSVSGKIVDAKGTPIPAAAVRLTTAGGGSVLETVTELDGTFSFADVPAGSCMVSVEMTGFEKTTRTVELGAGESSRVTITLPRSSSAGSGPPWKAPAAEAPRPRTETPEAARSAFSEVEVLDAGASTGSTSGALTANSPGPARQEENPEMLVITGYASASLDAGDWNDPGFRARMAEMGQRMGFGDVDTMQPPAEGEGGPATGSPGFMGGPMGGAVRPRGGGGGPGMGRSLDRSMADGPGFGRMGRGRQQLPSINVSVFSNYRNSALNAKSYSITGSEVSKPLQIQNSFGISMGGVLPGSSARAASARRIQQPGMWFVSYEGSRNRNPFDVLTTVPTELERAGDFSQTALSAGQFAGSSVSVYDPVSGSPFAGNRIPASRMNPAALALLQYIPLPNLPGAVQNFTMQRGLVNTSDLFSGRVSTRLSSKDSIFVNYSFRRGDSLASQIFPGLDTDRNNRAQNVGIGGNHRFQTRFILNYRLSFNRVRTSSINPFSYGHDVAGALGITGVSSDPVNFGIPTITFTNYGDLQVGNPALLRTQTFTAGAGLLKLGTKHSIQAGGDISWHQRNSDGDPNARGTFDFTGYATSAFTEAGTPVAGSGYDFADFLLGLPYGTSRRFGSSLNYLRNISLNLFVQDNWRVRANLTVSIGLRYEYIQPLYEKYDHMVSLEVAPGFREVAQVFPGQTGPYGGIFPRSLLFSDLNNFGPRIGLAWKPSASSRLVFRAGYGILYNPSVYPYIAGQLVGQPPFAVGQTLLATPSQRLTLQAGFPVAPSVTIRNSYAIDPHYRIGYIQQWNLSLQMPLWRVYVVDAGYLGSKGTRLDLLRAPNRSLAIGNADYFLYQQSGANSILHCMRMRVARRLTHGFRIENSYTFSKSIDNASGIGGALAVAQNDADLFAERSLSSFDQRHRFESSFNFSLPIGQNRRFLAGASTAVQNLVSGWEISGSYRLNSGQPLTARILGNVSNNSGTGSFSSERPDSTGISPTLPRSERTTSRYFNTLAFSIPAYGTFGNAGRFTITAPGSNLLNLTVRKNFRLNEGTSRLELRWQVTNALNHPNYGGLGTVVNALNFGRVTTVQAMRQMEIGVRLNF